MQTECWILTPWSFFASLLFTVRKSFYVIFIYTVLNIGNFYPLGVVVLFSLTNWSRVNWAVESIDFMYTVFIFHGKVFFIICCYFCKFRFIKNVLWFKISLSSASDIFYINEISRSYAPFTISEIVLDVWPIWTLAG